MVQKLKQRTRELTFEIVFFVEPDGGSLPCVESYAPGAPC
jgi:hypothetical protein